MEIKTKHWGATCQNFLTVLKADYEKGLISDGNIETTYLAELIDRIF